MPMLWGFLSFLSFLCLSGTFMLEKKKVLILIWVSRSGFSETQHVPRCIAGALEVQVKNHPMRVKTFQPYWVGFPMWRCFYHQVLVTHRFWFSSGANGSTATVGDLLLWSVASFYVCIFLHLFLILTWSSIIHIYEKWKTYLHTWVSNVTVNNRVTHKTQWNSQMITP